MLKSRDGYFWFRCSANDLKGFEKSVVSVTYDDSGMGFSRSFEIEQDFVVEYDELDRIIRMKWKVYSEIYDEAKGWCFDLDQGYKTAQCDLSYRDDGYLLNVTFTGYYFNQDKGYLEDRSRQYEFNASQKLRPVIFSSGNGLFYSITVTAKDEKKSQMGRNSYRLIRIVVFIMK